MPTLAVSELRPWHHTRHGIVEYAYPITGGRFDGDVCVVFRDRSTRIWPHDAVIDAWFAHVIAPADYPADAPLSPEDISAWEWRRILEQGSRNGHAWARNALRELDREQVASMTAPRPVRIPGTISARAIATGTIEPFPAELSIEHDLETDAYYVAVHDLTEDTERGIWLTPAAMRKLIAAAQTLS